LETKSSSWLTLYSKKCEMKLEKWQGASSL
jgi:hypothetical protein